MNDSSTQNIWNQWAQNWFSFLPEGAREKALLLLFMIIGIIITTLVLRRLKAQAGLTDRLEFEKDEQILPPKTQATPSSISTPVQEEKESVNPTLISESAPEAPQTHYHDVEEIKNTDHGSWLNNLKRGLSKTRTQFSTRFTQLFTGKNAINDEILEEVHEILFRGDLGVTTTDLLVSKIRARFAGATPPPTWEDVREELELQMKGILEASTKPLNRPTTGPMVILVVGVNGVGKTTSIGKLAAHFLAQDKSVLLCAADTFRAAAIEQLQIWGERLGIDVIKHQAGADPAAVAYDATQAAVSRKMDVLIVDTAGRLHNKKELMDELGKIKRSIAKGLPGAPHETWLVVDATTGQNAVIQTQAFQEVAEISGMVVTKLDGTAKGGVVVGICDKFKIPIRYIGVGEKAADLRAFSPEDYAKSLF